MSNENKNPIITDLVEQMMARGRDELQGTMHVPCS